MARKIEALVLRNICTESEGVIRQGNIAKLTGVEMEHYISIGAVQRPAFVAADIDDIPDIKDCINTDIEGGDA